MVTVGVWTPNCLKHIGSLHHIQYLFCSFIYNLDNPGLDFFILWYGLYTSALKFYYEQWLDSETLHS